MITKLRCFFLVLLSLAGVGGLSASTHTFGGKSVLVLVSEYPDALLAKSQAQFQADFDAGFKIGQAGGVDAYYRRNSYGKTWFTSITVRKVRLANNKASYANDYYGVMTEALALSGENQNNYDRVMSVAAGTITSTGLAYVGGTQSFYNNADAAGVATHELGHNWGNWHANFWNPSGSDPLIGASVEYGNSFDNMAGINLYDWNSAKKYHLDFLTPSATDGTKVLDVTSSGTYRLAAFDTDTAAPGAVRSLRLTRAGTTIGSAPALFIDYRQTQFSTNAFSWNGVHLYADLFGSLADNLIDTNPATPAPATEVSDAPLVIGRTFYDPGADVYITPLAKVAASSPPQIDVRLNFGPISGNAAPTVAVGASNAAPGVGVATTITATAADSNGDPLAYAWDFGDGTFSNNAAAVQSKSYAAAGWYRVTVTANDMKGGTASASMWINAGNSPNRTPEGGTTVGGIAYRYYEGVFTTMPNFGQMLPKKSGTVTGIDLSPRDRNDNFAFLYDGYITVPATDVYTFTVKGDDGFRFYFGNSLLIDSNTVKSAVEAKSASIGLAAAKHQFRLEYFHKDGAEELGLTWRTLNGTAATIPGGNFGQTDSSANPAPVVAITTPEEGSQTVVGGSVLFQATATDANGIARVQFFSDASFLGEATTAPYAVTWENVSVGAKVITAVAYDTTGRWASSAVRNFAVVSPEPRQSIGLNFNTNVSAGLMNLSDNAGAVYQQQNWNNLSNATGASTLVRDSLGNTVSGLGVSWIGYETGQSSNADTSNAAGRMMKGYLKTRYDRTQRPTVDVENIPYREYDVYVYSDLENTPSIYPVQTDTTTSRFVMIPGSGPAPAPVFLVNSLIANDGLGDYPNYDTWIGFKEATGAAISDPVAARLGNFVVFRGISGSSFSVMADRGDLNVGQHLALNAVQIVEAPATGPKIYVSKTGVSTTSIEGGAGDSYLVELGYAPTSDVTITVSPDAQVAVDKTSLVFTPANWETPQMVTISAMDDVIGESSPHSGVITHSVSAAGNYAAITSAAPINVDITDNDLPTVAVAATGSPAEVGPVIGQFQIARAAVAALGVPLVVDFQVSGTAALSGDYVLSGSELTSYSTSTGVGTVTIPAGQAQVFLTLTPVNDTAAEGPESVTITLTAAGSYALRNSAATLFINDNDHTDYFVQWFTTGQIDPLFDLSNKKVTFTPNGSSSYYAAVTDAATAFPSTTIGHFSYKNNGVLNENDDLDNGCWQVTGYPIKFYGTTYNSYNLYTDGQINLDGYNNDPPYMTDLAYTFYDSRRVALYWRDLNPGAGGDVLVGRDSTTGQERAIVTYVGVPRSGSTTEKINVQAEFFDSGVITLTWLACHPGATYGAVGFSNRTNNTLPPGLFETNFSAFGPAGTTPNSAPAFASLPPLFATAGTLFSYTARATDLENDPLTISAPTKPAWLTLTDHGDGSATLSGTPPSSGMHAITLRVSDGSVTADQAFTLSTLPFGGNNAPVFTSLPVTFASTGVLYSYSITATDADGHALTLTAPSKPSWLSLASQGNGNATLSGVVPIGALAPEVTLAASDGYTTTLQSFTMVLGDPPSVVVTPENPQVIVGASRQFSAVMIDASGIPLNPQPVFTWSLSGGGSISQGGLFTAGAAAGSFTVSATAAGLTTSTGFTVEADQAVSIFSAYFNNGSGSGIDDDASLYNWSAAIGSGGVLDGTLTGAPGQVGVSQGITTSGANGGVPLIDGQSTLGGFLFALPDAVAGVQLLYTTHLTTSATYRDNPQPDWFRSGADTLASLKVADITRLSVYTRPATTATKMRFALRVGENWVVSTTVFNQGNVNVYEQRILENLTAANAWYASAFMPGSSLDADLSNNPTVTLNAADPVTGYGWYSDTDSQSVSNSRVRIDSMVISAYVAPPPAAGYAAWAADVFPPGTPAGDMAPEADYDHDGLNNLLEYALLGGDPLIGNSGILPASSMTDSGGNRYLTLTTEKNPDATDITYQVEVSDDLTSWDTGVPFTTTLTDSAATLVVRDNTPSGGANSHRFIRLKVSTP